MNKHEHKHIYNTGNKWWGIHIQIQNLKRAYLFTYLGSLYPDYIVNSWFVLIEFVLVHANCECYLKFGIFRENTKEQIDTSVFCCLGYTLYYYLSINLQLQNDARFTFHFFESFLLRCDIDLSLPLY